MDRIIGEEIGSIVSTGETLVMIDSKPYILTKGATNPEIDKKQKTVYRKYNGEEFISKGSTFEYDAE